MSEERLENQQKLVATSSSYYASNLERMVHVSGVEMCVETFGNPHDQSLLLLALGQRLATRYDYRDTGRSICYDPGTAIYSLRDFAEEALGLLDIFGLAKAHLVGFLISSRPVGAYGGEPDIGSMCRSMTKSSQVVYCLTGALGIWLCAFL